MIKDVKMRVMAGKNEAERIQKEINSNTEICYNDFDSLFTKYLCFKFMLEPSEITVDNFYEICELSAQKASNLPKGLLDASELASKCGGATTAMNKKVLFIIALKREFNISITEDESVAIETFSELKKMVFDKIKGNI